MKSFIFFLFFCLFLMVLGRNLTFLPQIQFEKEVKSTPVIKEKVMEYISTQNGSFSVYFKDLKTGEEFGINENRVLTAASINKIYIISYLYNLAKNGKIDLEDKVMIQKEDIQDYGTGTLRYQKPGKSYSFKTLAQLSFEKSDNTAAHVLGLKLGMEKTQVYIESLTLRSTSMTENETSAKDTGRILELIYKNKITTPALSREMLDFMKDTDFEDRLPRYIDKNISVYHKIGDAVGIVHDAGIIDNGKTPFVLVVMTSDMADEEKAKTAIGRIAELIYNNKN